MKPKKVIVPPKEYFPKVREAREALSAKALEIYERQLSLIEKAVELGDIQAAIEANQWLIEHMPAEEGVRLIDPSAAKPKELEQVKGPSIQIGIALGGVGQSTLPPHIIDITPDDK